MGFQLALQVRTFLCKIEWPTGCTLLQLASILVTMAGSFALMKGPFPMPVFFIAGAMVYMGTIVLEAVSMSLTSKVRLTDLAAVSLKRPHLLLVLLMAPVVLRWSSSLVQNCKYSQDHISMSEYVDSSVDAQAHLVPQPWLIGPLGAS